jgi:hypothetical protein
MARDESKRQSSPPSFFFARSWGIVLAANYFNDARLTDRMLHLYGQSRPARAGMTCDRRLCAGTSRYGEARNRTRGDPIFNGRSSPSMLNDPQGSGRDKDAERGTAILAGDLAMAHILGRGLFGGTSSDGETRTRTGDTTIFSRVLYQLSYLAVVGLRPGPMLPARCGRARALSSVPGRCSEAPLVLALRCAHLPACSQASRYGSGSIVCPPGAYQPPTHISKCRCGALASPVRPARHSVWPAASACPALTASVAA